MNDHPYAADGNHILGPAQPDGTRPTLYTSHGQEAEQAALKLAEMLNAAAELLDTQKGKVAS